MTETHVIILAAGLGKRLGYSSPKCLTLLENGKTILQQQIERINSIQPDSIGVVVGFKNHEVIAEAWRLDHRIRIINNEEYETTNTADSLLKALMSFPCDTNVLWLNGDVVFTPTLLPSLKQYLTQPTIAVNDKKVNKEEIKYTLNVEGQIKELSKKVSLKEAQGEAVGINYIPKESFTTFKKALEKTNSNDYFEKAIETTIIEETINWNPFNITEHKADAIEIDFRADLKEANTLLK